MTINWGLGQPSVTALDRVSAPAIPPVTLAEAKGQLNVEHSASDAHIATLIGAAVDLIDGDGYLNRAMIAQNWAQWVGQSPGTVRLGLGPFLSLVSIEYYDADGALQSSDIADFEVLKSGDFALVRPKNNRSWPRTQVRPDAIKITFRAGFGETADAVPQAIKHAILLLVAYWYDNRMAASEASLKDIPLGFDALIGRHRVGWYG